MCRVLHAASTDCQIPGIALKDTFSGKEKRVNVYITNHRIVVRALTSNDNEESTVHNIGLTLINKIQKLGGRSQPAYQLTVLLKNLRGTPSFPHGTADECGRVCVLFSARCVRIEVTWVFLSHAGTSPDHRHCCAAGLYHQYAPYLPPLALLSRD